MGRRHCTQTGWSDKCSPLSPSHPRVFVPPQAYYALAKQWHPDANKAAGAEARFQEISKAYTVLSDGDQRAAYDAVGHSAFEQHGGDAGREPGGGGGQGFPGGGFPGGFPGGFSFRSGGGGGDNPNIEEILGAFFGGARPSRDLGASVTLDLGDVATGAQVTVKVPGARDGAPKDVPLFIPPGVQDGMRLRVPGRGMPAAGRGQPAGDLIVTVRVRDHPQLTREGDHLHCSAAVGVATAALGGAVRVPTLGGDVDIVVPPGSQPGDTLRLRGRGVPRLDTDAAGAPGAPAGPRGDQFVRLDVRVPRALSRAQRTAFEALRDEEERLAAPGGGRREAAG